MWRDESSFIHLLMALHMCLPVIFLSLRRSQVICRRSWRTKILACITLVHSVQINGEFCSVLHGPVLQVLSAVQIIGVSTLEEDVCIARIEPVVGTLKSVCIIEVSAFQGCPQGRVPLHGQTKTTAGMLYDANPLFKMFVFL